MPIADFEPLLVVALVPKEDIEIEDPQIANIDLMCQLHYQAHPRVTEVGVLFLLTWSLIKP